MYICFSQHTYYRFKYQIILCVSRELFFRRLDQPPVKPINQAMENLIFLRGFFAAS